MDFSKMTLREKVLQTFVTCSYFIKKEKSIEDFFRKYPVGGLYFAKSHAQDLAKEMEDGTITSASFIDKCRAASALPLLVCADGANIGKDGIGSIHPMALAAANDLELAYEVGRAHGMQMNYNKIDWILGPCIDMAFCHVSDLVSHVATDDAALNASMYAAWVRGIQDQGVMATVKHFPGLGTHHVNFHYGPGQNIMDMDTWMDTYGKSYLACFREDCMSVMTSHLTLRAWSERGDNGRLPIATYSSDITVGLLKEKLGFRGAVVTDALMMGGMGAGNQAEEAAQAFASGADLLLWPPMETCDIIVEKLESGEIPMSRLEDALSRIAYVRSFLGYQGKERVYGEADADYVDDVFRRVAAKGVTLVANEESILPLSPEKHKKVLVVGCAEDESKMKQLHPIVDALRARGFEAEFQEYLLLAWQDQVNARQAEFDLALVVYNCPLTVSVNPHCASTSWSAHLLDKKKSMFLNFSSPHFADDYFPEARTFVNVHSTATSLGVDAALACLFGDKPFEGKSPVKLKRA